MKQQPVALILGISEARGTETWRGAEQSNDVLAISGLEKISRPEPAVFIESSEMVKRLMPPPERSH